MQKILIILLLFTGLLKAQDTSIVKKNPPSWLKKFKYRYLTDGIWTTGNIERILISSSFSLNFHDSTLSFGILPKFTYGELTSKLLDGTKSNVVQEREYFLDLNLGLFSEKKFYGFGMGTLEKSNLRTINFRWYAGLGAGWHIVRNHIHKSTFSIAVLREETDFTNDIALNYQIFRGSFRLKGKHDFFKNRCIVHYIFNYLPSIIFDKNVRFNSNITLEFPINKHFSFKTAWDFSHENVVTPDKRKDDSRYTLGIVIGN